MDTGLSNLAAFSHRPMSIFLYSPIVSHGTVRIKTMRITAFQSAYILEYHNRTQMGHSKPHRDSLTLNSICNTPTSRRRAACLCTIPNRTIPTLRQHRVSASQPLLLGFTFLSMTDMLFLFFCGINLLPITTAKQLHYWPSNTINKARSTRH